ncbi:MAG: hypothetical protein ACHQK8_07215 [Bacteroidia bacterium]
MPRKAWFGRFANPLLSSKESTFRKHGRKCGELYGEGNCKHTTSHAIIKDIVSCDGLVCAG